MAIEALAAAVNDVHVHVHAARKAIRRARSLAALAGSRFNLETADELLHRVGDSLGALRDAHVVALVAAGLGQRSTGTGWENAADRLASRADRLTKARTGGRSGFRQPAPDAPARGPAAASAAPGPR
ncbi:CHAD domain-containing protein [Pseudoxanthomonas sp. NC8]|nr:CHAD domain-containing protein [Pseudoxanthomonas sp. NC8]